MDLSPSLAFKLLVVFWGFTYCSPATSDQNKLIKQTIQLNDDVHMMPPDSSNADSSNADSSNADSSNADSSNVGSLLPDSTVQTVQPSIPAPAKTYYFDVPDALFKLPKELREISGLSVLDDKHLAAVQDEKGKIFSVRIADGKIIDDKRFTKDGDFEGIELVGDSLFVLRSDGDIYRVTDWLSSNMDTQKYETTLSTKHDTEGLGYDAGNNRLLIVCKEHPGSGLKNSRAVYGFDLKTHKLIEKPILVINLRDIENLTENNPLNKSIRKLVSPLKNLSDFKPSALAVHPKTKQIFIISSVRKLLLAYHNDGTLEDLWVLPEDNFRQPEGLAFMPNGDLFISNEGGNGRATLMRFNYK